MIPHKERDLGTLNVRCYEEWQRKEYKPIFKPKKPKEKLSVKEIWIMIGATAMAVAFFILRIQMNMGII